MAIEPYIDVNFVSRFYKHDIQFVLYADAALSCGRWNKQIWEFTIDYAEYCKSGGLYDVTTL
jgi:hypothetical protein